MEAEGDADTSLTRETCTIIEETTNTVEKTANVNSPDMGTTSATGSSGKDKYIVENNSFVMREDMGKVVVIDTNGEKKQNVGEKVVLC